MRHPNLRIAAWKFLLDSLHSPALSACMWLTTLYGVPWKNGDALISSMNSSICCCASLLRNSGSTLKQLVALHANTIAYLLPCIDRTGSVRRSIEKLYAGLVSLYGSTVFIILRMLPLTSLQISHAGNPPPKCAIISCISSAVIFLFSGDKPGLTPLRFTSPGCRAYTTSRGYSCVVTNAECLSERNCLISSLYWLSVYVLGTRLASCVSNVTIFAMSR